MYNDLLYRNEFYDERARTQEAFAAELERRRNRPAVRRLEERDVKDWESFLSVFFYKPNFYIKFIAANEDEGNRVYLSMLTDNSRLSIWGNELVEVTCVNPVSTWTTVENALQEMRTHIKALEMHEADEWIQFNGYIPFDPHR